MACVHRDARRESDDAESKLRRAETAAQGDPSQEARAGWYRYLIASDPRGAERHFLADGKSPLALAGLAELAEDRTDTLAAARLWIRALQAEPLSPIAEVACVRLLDVEGDSPEVDDAIAGATVPPLAPRAARLFREARARIAGRRGDDGRAWRELGAIQHWRVAGPFGALRLLELSKAFPLDGPTPLRASANERSLDFPDGDLGLDLEPGDGDIFYAASEISLERGGDYLLWVEGAAALEMRIDGAVIVSRAPYPRETPRSQTAAVRLAKGAHQVLARWSRSEGARFRTVLSRADGAAADLSSAAPAELTGLRAAAPCALGTSCKAAPAWRDESDLRAAAAAMLEKDPSDPLGAWLAARASMGDDRAAARAAVERALALSFNGAPALTLRAQQLLHDPEVPERIGRGRALSDLTEATAKNPSLIRARLTAAALERDSERFDDAAQDLDRAETALGPNAPLPPRLLVARARLLDARGNPAKARALAEAALAGSPGRCDALQLAYELARRESALADQRRLAESLLSCVDGISTAAQFFRERGELARAEELLARWASLRPAAPSRLEQLADVQSARKEFPQAVASLRKAAALAPRSPEPLRRLAGLLELSGDMPGASEARRRALKLSPGELQLRSQLALDEKQKLLAWTDRDALALARSGAPPPAGASAVRLLDYGAAQIFPDGGAVERVHTLVRVLDKKGVSRFGEAQVPGDAMVLHLRTLKADGRVLEPEAIPEKEGISLPGLEPGDAVETDYLRGIAPRGPEMPGFTLSGFFFRDEETPMGESTYECLAPSPIEVDAHNLVLPPDALAQDRLHFRYSARDVVPQQPEPHQPSENELMPWVQLGAGAGEKELIRSIADWALLRTRPSSSTDALARDAGGDGPLDKAQRIYAKVAQAVRGRSQGGDFASSAAHVLAQGRGNRLVVFKAALASAGIPSHVVLVRTFAVDPAPYRFPRGELYNYAVLRIDLPSGPVWADAQYRLSPFGELPVYARGRDAWTLPEPGEEPENLRTPDAAGRDGRTASIDLRLDAEGAAAGTARDEHRGFEAASLKDALERLDGEQRKQAVESMLGRGMRGLVLESLAAEHENDLGGSATIVAKVRVQLARRDGEKLFVPTSLMPDRLARRWAAKAERSVVLLVDAPEDVAARYSIALPEGRHLRSALQPVELRTPFGQYKWSAREESGKLIVEESLSLPQQRVAPAQYPAFAAFARGVDEAQSQELLVAPYGDTILTPTFGAESAKRSLDRQTSELVSCPLSKKTRKTAARLRCASRSRARSALERHPAAFPAPRGRCGRSPPQTARAPECRDRARARPGPLLRPDANP
jgi:tetratricopeptide (TPR) repeat protein